MIQFKCELSVTCLFRTGIGAGTRVVFLRLVSTPGVSLGLPRFACIARSLIVRSIAGAICAAFSVLRRLVCWPVAEIPSPTDLSADGSAGFFAFAAIFLATGRSSKSESLCWFLFLFAIIASRLCSLLEAARSLS